MIAIVSKSILLDLFVLHTYNDKQISITDLLNVCFYVIRKPRKSYKNILIMITFGPHKLLELIHRRFEENLQKVTISQKKIAERKRSAL